MSVSTLPCSLAGQLCVRTRSHQARENPKHPLSPREGGCVPVLRPTMTQGAAGPGGQGVEVRAGPASRDAGPGPTEVLAGPGRARAGSLSPQALASPGPGRRPPAPRPQPWAFAWAGLPAVCWRPND